MKGFGGKGLWREGVSDVNLLRSKDFTRTKGDVKRLLVRNNFVEKGSLV